MALQTELAQSRGQVLALTQRFDALATAHQTLNSEADRLFREKSDQIAALEGRLSQTLNKQTFDLLDLKSMKPERFSGLRAEAWKPWARKFKAYCNGKAQGFRSALEWAELQQTPLLNNFGGCPWSQVQTADAKLHDFLCATLGGEAGLLSETPGLEGQGFEVWRRLTAKYAPTGGQFEIDSLISLLNPKAAKDMAHLPGAIAKFEHDYLQYEKRSGETFPEKYKVAALVQIMPKTQAADLKWRFANGLSNYDSMVEQIETYSQHLRHESAYGRGEADDRMVDALGKAQPQPSGDWLDHATGAEVAAFYEGLQEGMVSTAKDMPDVRAEDQPLDLMYKKGKGKGKGKRGPPQGGGKGRDAGQDTGGGKGKGNGKFCKHCLTKNHDESECRKKAAGMSAADSRRTRPARSLEHAQAQLDLINGKAPQGDWVEQMGDRDAGFLEREIFALEF